MEKKPIYYILGVEGHFYTAEALAREFRLPVVGIVMNKAIEERLTPERRAIFSRLHSIPAFLREAMTRIEKLSNTELDAEQEALERKYGMRETTRYMYFDRSLSYDIDFQTARRLQLAYLRFIDSILSQDRPCFVLDGVATYFQHTMRQACRSLGIPYLHSMDARNGRIAFFTPDGQQIGMESTYEALRSGRIGPENSEAFIDADRWYEGFLKRPSRPDYADRCSRQRIDPASVMRKILGEFRHGRWRFSWRDQKPQLAIDYRGHPLANIGRGIAGRARWMYQSRAGLFDKSPDLSAKFIYLPLHFAPEISDIVFGSEYDHHQGFVTQLAKHIPYDCQLYVKEHTSMLGRRATDFYADLRKLYNVRLISPFVDTFTLIRHCRAVVTVTGTAGWEAYLLGKPCIVLGDVFYNFLPGVLHVRLDRDFNEAVRRYLESFSFDPEERRCAIRAWFATSYSAKKGDIGHDTPPDQALENARQFALAFRKFLAAWRHEVDGEFSQELIAEVA
jgi:hypothetical protein